MNAAAFTPARIAIASALSDTRGLRPCKTFADDDGGGGRDLL
jgi:hypothetical protein